MKQKTYTTTEFYKKPSEALSFVKDGGIVYLGYKNLKEPIAVLTSMKDYKLVKENELKASTENESFFERYKKYIISAPEYKDSAKYIRHQREKK